MSRLPNAFHEDRALRDAARAVLVADVEHARTTLSGKGLAERVTGRIGDGAKDVLEVAKVNTVGRPGLIAGLVAIIALWFARGPILEALGLDALDDTGEAEDASEADESVQTDAELNDGEAASDNLDTDRADHDIKTPDPASAPETDATTPLTTGDMA